MERNPSNLSNPITVTYGTDLLQHFDEKQEGKSKCVKVHMISHRYGKGAGKTENAKDKFTYHSFVLMEWDHGNHCTIAEIGWLNGLSGYKAKSNCIGDT